MTPKEKAKELVYRFFKMFGGANKIQDDFEWSNAKDSALIAVDEILNADILSPQLKRHYVIGIAPKIDELEYWQQVKTEIDKL